MAGFSSFALAPIKTLWKIDPLRFVVNKIKDKLAPKPATDVGTPATTPSIGDPTPPDAIKAASDAAAAALAASARTKRRAAAGNAGRVLLPRRSPAQLGIQEASTPRTLLGS